MINVCLINLGCAKNLVDSEAILALFDKDSRFKITIDENETDVLILNTCAFIFDAENESFETIEELSKLNKKLVVLGCLVEKYKNELKKKFPKVNLFVGFKDFYRLPELLGNLLNENINKPYTVFNRIEDNGASIYLKISEGCNHNCGYCIIPKLRGTYYSYNEEDIYNYALNVVNKGIKEITLIAQDTTYYGKDFKDGTSLSSLLKKLDSIEGIEFLRVLYLYPNEVDYTLISTIKNSKHILPYFDLPIQHASTKILKAMNRNDSYDSLLNLVLLIRKEIPEAILRCTLITGYPFEEDSDIEILKEFLLKARFHHVGCFTYSNENLAKAYSFPQIDEKIKEKRRDEIMNFQKKISYELNKELIGKVFKGIIIGQENNNTYLVRTLFNAPDDIDGGVYMKTNIDHKLGDIIKIKITDAFVYDLYGEEV